MVTTEEQRTTETQSEPPMSAPNSVSDEKTILIISHLGGVIGMLGALVPLVMLLVKPDASPYAKMQIKEALNFQITMLIGFAVGFILLPVLMGGLIIPVVALANLIICIMAAISINDGKDYKYPFALRLVK